MNYIFIILSYRKFFNMLKNLNKYFGYGGLNKKENNIFIPLSSLLKDRLFLHDAEGACAPAYHGLSHRLLTL